MFFNLFTRNNKVQEDFFENIVVGSTTSNQIAVPSGCTASNDKLVISTYSPHVSDGVNISVAD